jgi:hypothetical protein
VRTVLNVCIFYLQTLKQQQDRDEKVRALWGTVLDALDFMRQAQPLKAIEGLEQTVQATMKQIYDCTLFLRSYGERSFISKCFLVQFFFFAACLS